jgi:hypothetical protein
MTHEYAVLSIRAGCLAAAVGTQQAISYMRAHGWNLSEEFLSEFKRAAVAAGTKPEDLEAAEALARKYYSRSEFIEGAMTIQRQVDARNSN